MSAITLVIALGITASVFSSAIIVAATMLSSRISRAENVLERFERVEERPSFAPRTYPVES